MFSRACLLLTILSSCTLVFDATDQRGDDGGIAPPGSWLEGFTYRKKITFQPSKLSSTLVDYPAAISLSSDVDIANSAPRGRPDFAITASDGESIIPYELESITQDGSLSAWVALETLDKSGAVVYLYFQNPTASTSHEQVNATWPDHVTSAWHLSESPAATPPRFADSAGRNHGESTGTELPSQVTGRVGPGLALSGADYQISFGDPADGSLDFGLGSFSFSTWVFVTESDNSYDFAMWKGGTADTLVGYGYALGTDEWRVGLSDGTAPGNQSVTFGQEASHLGRWVQLATVVDRESDELTAYVDGTPEAVLNISGVQSISTDLALSIGNSFSPFKGLIDEMRVYNTTLPADWIATEFENLNEPLFTSVGVLETAP